MKLGILIPLLILLIVGGTGAVDVAIGQPQTPSGPVAEAPAFKEGDEWRFTGGSWRKVIGFEGEHVITTSGPSRRCRDCRYYRDKNLTVIKVLDAKGQPAPGETTGSKILDFPLFVGKEWSFSIDLPQRSTGQMMPYDNFFKVEAYEDVKTKAGTFKAFRVLYRQENRGPYPWSGRATFWYAPEVKWFVKWDVHTSGWGEGWEMESYTLK